MLLACRRIGAEHGLVELRSRLCLLQIYYTIPYAPYINKPLIFLKKRIRGIYLLCFKIFVGGETMKQTITKKRKITKLELVEKTDLV